MGESCQVAALLLCLGALGSTTSQLCRLLACLCVLLACKIEMDHDAGLPPVACAVVFGSHLLTLFFTRVKHEFTDTIMAYWYIRLISSNSIYVGEVNHMQHGRGEIVV